MTQLKHVQSSLGWCLIGLLLTDLLINVIGFVSPFWGVWRHPGELYVSRDLLHFWQPIVAWFSICFVVAAWHLARTVRSTVARIGILAMGVLVVAAEVGSGFARRAMEQADSPVPPQLPATINVLAGIYLALVAIAYTALIWRAVRQSNSSLESQPLRGPADPAVR